MSGSRVSRPLELLPQPDDRPGPIRVVELVATASGGGAQEHVASLLTGFDRERFDIRVISLAGGCSLSRWRDSGRLVEVIDLPDDDAAEAAVAERLEAWDTQVLHAHMYRAEVIGARAASRLLPRGLPRPWVIGHVHSSRVRSREDQALLRAVDPSIDRLVAVSHAIEAKIRAERPASSRISLVYNGVDLERFAPIHSGSIEGAPESPGPVVGCVARLEPEKGHDTLLRAWRHVLAAVPHARLQIVGSGSRLATLRAQAETLGLSGPEVEFMGHRYDIPMLTRGFSVAVLPSYREAQGLAVIEAMAAARPVVASRVGGIVEMIEHERTGLLVAPGDADGLAKALIRLLEERALSERLGRAGWASVAARYRVEDMLTSIGELYEEGALAWARRTDVDAVAGRSA